MMHDHEPICISPKEFPAIIMYANSKAKGSSAGFSTICCMGLLLTNAVQFDQETGTSFLHKMQHAAVQHHNVFVCAYQAGMPNTARWHAHEQF